ncbi:MAG: hypothetical protein WBX23_06110 [Candidatus Cybelea sp.]
MKLLLPGRRVLSTLAAAAILSGCGGAQSVLNTSGPIQQNTAHSAIRHPGVNPSIPFNVYNGATQTIHLSSEVLPPTGKVGCPWVTYYPTLIYELVPGIYMFPSPPDYVAYFTSCSPFNEPAVWSFSFGTDITNPITICSGSVSYVGSPNLNLSVKNTPQTSCTFQQTTVNGISLALFTYNVLTPSGKRQRSHLLMH